ncbi:MAG: hypothetical protein IPL73_23585 [Candidatus Obscuribacter sp.]|nr:hypothetical protein [Candidatus Obscuribacter sp.]
MDGSSTLNSAPQSVEVLSVSYILGKPIVSMPGVKPGLYEVALLKSDGKPTANRAWIVLAGQKPGAEVLAVWKKERAYIVGKSNLKPQRSKTSNVARDSA